MTPDIRSETANSSETRSESASKPKRLDLSLTQIIGGSLAAATAAGLGSTLGVAGTIVGAAVFSVISAVAASIYTASLRHTREAAKAAVEVVRVKRLDSFGATDANVPDLPTATISGVGSSSHEATAQLPVSDRIAATAQRSGRDNTAGTTEFPGSDAAVNESGDRTTTVVDVPAGRSTRSRLRLRPVLIGAAGIFALTAVGITGYELASGQSIAGGKGTTIGHVVRGGNDTSAPSPVTDSPSEKAPATSTRPSRDGATSSEAPRSSTPPSDSSQTTSPSATTTPATPSATPSTTPSAPATPSTTAPGAQPTPQSVPGADQGTAAPTTGS